LIVRPLDALGACDDVIRNLLLETEAEPFSCACSLPLLALAG
jgi:hypothetical protein